MSHNRPLRRNRLSWWLILLLGAYVVVAYLAVPLIWVGYEDIRPSLSDSPRLTKTSDGHPGDPLNVSLVGSETEVRMLMRSAQWFAADPLSLKSDIEIGADTLLERTYRDAPVSKVYLYGRKEDLAFERPVVENPCHRHHVRLWRCPDATGSGRATWIGSASFDDRVGLSHTTGQITHHISANVDDERDFLAKCLQATGDLTQGHLIADFHQTLEGRNGGGDLWRTDGGLWFGVIAASRP